jgi:O-antigen/teichoic acid export membrane protein
MGTAKKVVKNTSIFFGGNVIFKIISIIVTIYLARYLGVAGFGKYSIVFAYIGFFNVISDLGLQKILIREIAREGKNLAKVLGNAYFLKLLFTLIAFILAVIIINFLSYPEDIRILTYIGAFTIFFISFNDYYTALFDANLKTEYTISAKVISKIISAILILWIIFIRGSLAQIMIAIVFSEITKLLIGFYFSRRFIASIFEFDRTLIKYILKIAFPLAILSLISVTTSNAGIILLSKMKDETAVGIFSAASKLVTPLRILPQAITISLFPLMSSFYKTKDGKLEKILNLSIKYAVIAALPIAVGVTLLSQRFIILIYGNQFIRSSLVLTILIWNFVILSIQSIFFHALISINRQKTVTLSVAIATTIGLSLNIILIPLFGSIGVAIATIATNSTILMLYSYFILKDIRVVFQRNFLIKPVLSGILMGIFISNFISINIFILIPVAAIIYFLSLFGLKTFSVEEISRLKSISPLK